MAGLIEWLGSEGIEPRNMKQVGPAMKEVKGERIPNARLTGPAAEAAVSRAAPGLLSRIGGAIFGPIGIGAQAALTPGELGNGELSPEQREQLNPGEREAANQYAARIQQMARNANRPPNQPTMQAQAPQQAAPQPEQQAPTPQQVRAQMEPRRQQIQSTVKAQLQNSQLSRAKAAEAVVKADLERQGIEATPDEKKALVTAEVAGMRNMDNDSLARYVSYAIAGLGFLAGGTSEAAGQQFGQSFRQGYQNAIERAAYERKLAIEQQQQAIENKQKERDLTRKEKDTDSNVAYRGIMGGAAIDRVDQGERRINLDERKLDVDTQYKNARLGQFDAGLDLQRERNSLYASRVEAQNKKDAALEKKAQTIQKKGASLSTKDAQEFIDASLKASGYKLDDKSKVILSQQLRQYQASNPGADPNIVLKAVLDNAASQVNERSFGPIGLDPEFKLEEDYLFNE